MEDLLRESGAGQRISRVVRAVKMVSEEDPIDTIIIDRITD